jgi:hypothetical protein
MWAAFLDRALLFSALFGVRFASELGMLRLGITALVLLYSGVLTGAVDAIAQPLSANAERLLQSLEFLGHPIPSAATESLRKAIEGRDPVAIQKHLDPYVLFNVEINPELRASRSDEATLARFSSRQGTFHCS